MKAYSKLLKKYLLWIELKKKQTKNTFKVSKERQISVETEDV